MQTSSTVTFESSDGAKWAPAPDLLDSLRSQLRGQLCLPGRAGLRRGAHDLERDDRQAARADPRGRGPPTSCARSRRPRARPAARRPRRRPQHRRQRRLRRRPDDRPLADEVGARRPVQPDGARRARRDAGRVRPRGAGVRAGDPARHQLDDRRRRAHARRRLRLAEPQVRPDHRQPALGRRRHRRRRAASTRARRRTPTCSGRSAAAAATSASSPRSSSGCTRSGRRCSPASSSTRSPRRSRCCSGYRGSR